MERQVKIIISQIYCKGTCFIVFGSRLGKTDSSENRINLFEFRIVLQDCVNDQYNDKNMINCCCFQGFANITLQAVY